MRPHLLAVAAAFTLLIPGTFSDAPTQAVTASERPPLRITLTTASAPQSAPPSHCADYQAMEEGRGHPVNQHWFNHLDAKGYARVRMACLYQWGSDQYDALVELWDHESGWYHLADGPGTCWGIPQACEGSKMAAAGADWRTNPRTQVRWGLDLYIRERYGTPAVAWNRWQARRPHWY